MRPSGPHFPQNMSSTYYNDLEFKSEDAILALLEAANLDLAGAPVVQSLITDALETTHIAIIADDFEPSQNPPRTGNHLGKVRIKVVTSFDQVPPSGFANLRTVHRQRCGLIRDTLMRADLHIVLSPLVENFTVQGFNFGRISQRIVGRSWVTEWSVILEGVCGSDL